VAVEAWKRRYNEEALNVMWDATRKRGEKAIVEKLRLRMKSASAKSLVNGRREGDRRETATANEVGVGKESCERPKPSSSSDVSSERRREAAGKQASSRRE
jgi:hypothetical protein